MLKISSEENEDWSVVEKNHECQLSTARDILTDPSNINNKQSFVHFTSAASEVKFNFADQLSAKALISNFWKKLKRHSRNISEKVYSDSVVLELELPARLASEVDELDLDDKKLLLVQSTQSGDNHPTYSLSEQRKRVKAGKERISTKFDAIMLGSSSPAPTAPSSDMTNGVHQQSNGISKKQKLPQKPYLTVIRLTRPQLACAGVALLLAISLSILLTYFITKDALQRQFYDESISLSHYYAHKDRFASSRYDDQFEIKSLPHANNSLPINDKKKESDGITSPSAEELRLGNTLFPIWYNLTIKVYVPGFGADMPEKKNKTFDASLLLKFKVVQSTKQIELSASKLKFDKENISKFKILKDDIGHGSIRGNAVQSGNSTKSSSVDFNDKLIGGIVPANIKVVAVTVNETLEKVFFHLSENLIEGQLYYIRIPYSGSISTKLSGLYLTQYHSLDGKHRCAAVSQMEPTDSRKMVPSFDEPAFKAVYRLHVIHPVGSRAVSNAIELEENVETDDKQWMSTTFNETLPMSSYLLALVVSDFEFVEGHTKDNIRFRIWSRRDAVNLTSYALKAGIRVLEYYSTYYGIPFPLPKQDMMAIPDFAAGAMENWGLVTYREKYLLYSPDLYTSQQKMAVASVVAHELAHQWFGNLVTMKWWSDLWLNEGFATLVEYFGTDAISDGAFRMQDHFLLESLDAAFDRDARATSHPLHFEIQKAEDVSEAFDSITYSKGASILRMIMAVMGEEYFKKGVNIYLNRYKYSNAEHKDLWNALTEAVPSNLVDWSGKRFDVGEFAGHWTEQMGYPVIVVKRIDSQRVEVTQERFKLDENALEKPKFRNAKYWYKWDVPLWYSLNGTEQKMIWLHESTSMDAPEDDVLILNHESRGFYRVQYSKMTLARIQEQLFSNHSAISLKTRARIIDDTFTLAEAGRLPYEAALNLTRYLEKEEEYIPWEMALTGFNTIQGYFLDEPETEHLREYIKNIIGKLFGREIRKIMQKDLNDDDSMFFENLLNQRIIQRMCTLRDHRCIDKILSIYRENFVKPCTKSPEAVSSQCSSVPVPFRSLAYCEGIHYGSEKEWDEMLAFFEREPVQVEKERLMMALACSRDTFTLKKLLLMAADINNTVIRLQDKPSVFAHVSSRMVGKKIILDFFLDHWKQIYSEYKEQQTLLRSIISNSIIGNSKRVIDQVEKFMEENERSTKNLDIFKQRLEVLKTNRKWMEKNFLPLSNWFKQHNELSRKKNSNATISQNPHIMDPRKNATIVQLKHKR